MFRHFNHRVEGNEVVIDGRCVITDKEVKMRVPLAGFNAYYSEGKKIQDAFPTLSASDREYMVSGLSDEGFKMVCGPEEAPERQ